MPRAASSAPRRLPATSPSAVRAEQEQRQLVAINAKFRAFFDQGMNFAGVLALDGTVVEANRLCLDACGFTRDEVVGKPFWECGWWNRSAALKDMVRAGASWRPGGGCSARRPTTSLPAGPSGWLISIMAPVTDESGQVLFVAATGNDVTDRRRMEDSLREADRKKDEFIALLAHELRNPLAPIRNGLQVMRLAGLDAGAARRPGDDGPAALAHGPADRRPAGCVAHQSQQDGAAPLAGAAGRRGEQRRGDGSTAHRRRGPRTDRLAAAEARSTWTPT